MARDAGRRREATDSPPATGRRVHYEEALSTPVPSGTDHLVWIAVLVVASAVPVVVAYAYAPQSAGIPWMAAGPLAFGGIVVLLYLGSRSLTRVWERTPDYVRVTHRGVEVERNSVLPWASGVFVPFEEVVGVQYSDATDPHMRVSRRDHRDHVRGMKEADGFVTTASGHAPLTYYVRRRGNRNGLTYKGGVRIGRRDAPPVYVGSERPRELATAIAERSPDVQGIEPFESAGGQA